MTILYVSLWFHCWISLSSNCFSPEHFNLIFFSLCVSAGFCIFKSYFTYPIFFHNSAIKVDSFFDPVVFHLFHSTFSIFKAYYCVFFPKASVFFMLSLLTIPINLYLFQAFDWLTSSNQCLLWYSIVDSLSE